jgi:hypothetical protein
MRVQSARKATQAPVADWRWVVAIVGLLLVTTRCRGSREHTVGPPSLRAEPAKEVNGPQALTDVRVSLNSKKPETHAAPGSDESRPEGAGQMFRGRDVFAIRALARPDLGDSTRNSLDWEIAEWSSMPETLVALSARPVQPAEPVTRLEPHIALLSVSGGTLRRLAAGIAVLDKTNCDNTSGGPPDEARPKIALDLARYDLAPGQAALGLRLRCHNAFPAGEGSETRLILFVIEGADLRQVFSETIDWNDVQRGPDEATESHGVLVIDARQHRGHYDLLLKSKIERSSLGLREPQPPPRRSAITKRFVWNGSRYRAIEAP